MSTSSLRPPSASEVKPETSPPKARAPKFTCIVPNSRRSSETRACTVSIRITLGFAGLAGSSLMAVVLGGEIKSNRPRESR